MNLSVPTLIPEKSMRKKTAALYARVSSQQQKEEETIDSQIDTLLKFSKENDYEIPKEWFFTDEAHCGKTLDRPGIDNLRNMALECDIDAVFIYSPDRLARRYVLQLIIEEELLKLGIKVIYFKGRSQNNTPEDILLTHFQGIFAEYEHAQILDRTRRGKLYKVRQGDLRVLPNAPYGYYKERDTSFYTIKETEARIVREIFYLFTRDKLPLRQIARYLEGKNISAPKGGLKWDPKTLREILINTAYTGTAYFGKTEKYEGDIDRIARYKTKGKVIKPTLAKDYVREIYGNRFLCHNLLTKVILK